MELRDPLAVDVVSFREGEPPLAFVRKPDTVRRLGPVDAAPLAALVGRLSEAFWFRENAAKANDFPCFHHTRHVIFRFPCDVHDPRRFGIYPAWRLWSDYMLPVMRQAVAPYGLRSPVFPKAMLARLAAGHVIDAHRDLGRGASVTHKIHVPLQTCEGAIFHVAGEETHLAEGEAYEVNNLRLHGVANGGEIDRIHLIFEVFEGAPAGDL